jgi:hypothetical protein
MEADREERGPARAVVEGLAAAEGAAVEEAVGEAAKAAVRDEARAAAWVRDSAVDEASRVLLS